MIKPDKTIDEAARLAVLADLAILDTAPEQSYDDLVRIAAAICEVPMGSVSLIDSERQWFKASLGLESKETPREFAFCAHAILDPHATLVVEDALADARFQGNPFVTDAPNIRFYAGAPLIAGGQPVGTFCVMDDKPRQLQPEQLQALEALSRQASHLLELQRVGRALRHQLGERDWYEKKILADQAALIARNADLTEQTRTDPLTGLDNRRAFAVRLDEAIVSATARGAPLHVAVVDMDHFKTVNDLHGHQEGDRVLRAVSALLRSQQVARGRVARYGGEEFVLLLPDMDQAQARLQCEYLREAIAAMPLPLPVTVSIGLAAYRQGDTPQAVFARADAALYRAKGKGRNRVVVASA